MKLSFLIAGLFLFNLTYCQNIGIGTGAPNDKLDVRGSTTDDGVLITVGNADGSHKLGLFGGRLNDPNPFIRWKAGDPLRFGTDLSGFSELMRIMPNGNVGIGNTTPTLAKLQVHGMVGNMVAMFRGSSTSQGISFADDWPGIYFNSYWNDGLKSMSDNGYSSFINSEQANGDISFNLSNVANTAANSLITVPERMRITSSGNLGIATSNPTEKLEVNGNIKAQSYKLSTPKTSYYSVPPSAFQAMSSSDVTSVGAFAISFNAVPTPTGGIVAPVILPQGATVTSFTLYFYDNAAGTDIKADLLLHMHGTSSGALMASVSSAGMPLGGNAVDNTINNSFIDHQYFDYSIDVYSTVGAWPGSSLMLYSAVITYTVSEVN